MQQSATKMQSSLRSPVSATSNACLRARRPAAALVHLQRPQRGPAACRALGPDDLPSEEPMTLDMAMLAARIEQASVPYLRQ